MNIEFSKASDCLFSDIISFLDSIEDLDFTHDNAIIDIERKSLKYIINKHSIAQEVWLSSPKSGSHHFKYDDLSGSWLNSYGVEIFSILEEELQE